MPTLEKMDPKISRDIGKKAVWCYCTQAPKGTLGVSVRCPECGRNNFVAETSIEEGKATLTCSGKECGHNQDVELVGWEALG